MPEKETQYEPSPMHQRLKEVVWYQLAREVTQIGMDNGTLHRLKWLFRPQEFPCGNVDCRQSDTITFMVLPTGVYRTCSNEGFTEKIQPIDEGEMHLEAILLEDIVCNNQQALDVVKMYHQERMYLDPDSRVLFSQYRIPKRGVRKPPF